MLCKLDLHLKTHPKTSLRYSFAFVLQTSLTIDNQDVAMARNSLKRCTALLRVQLSGSKCCRLGKLTVESRSRLCGPHPGQPGGQSRTRPRGQVHEAPRHWGRGPPLRTSLLLRRIYLHGVVASRVTKDSKRWISVSQWPLGTDVMNDARLLPNGDIAARG